MIQNHEFKIAGLYQILQAHHQFRSKWRKIFVPAEPFSGQMVLLEVSLVVNAINSHVVGSLSDIYILAVNNSLCDLNVFRNIESLL